MNLRFKFAISKDGKLKSTNGNFIKIRDLDINPTLTKEQALQKALNHIGAKKYIWEDSENENLLKKTSKDSDATYYPQGELLIFDKKNDKGESIPTLAYKFDIYAINPLSRANYYVDASNGKILLADAIIKHVVGTASTRYSGRRTIETEAIGGQFRLRDQTRGKGIHTFNMNNGSN